MLRTTKRGVRLADMRRRGSVLTGDRALSGRRAPRSGRYAHYSCDSAADRHAHDASNLPHYGFPNVAAGSAYYDLPAAGVGVAPFGAGFAAGDVDRPAAAIPVRGQCQPVKRLKRE